MLAVAPGLWNISPDLFWFADTILVAVAVPILLNAYEIGEEDAVANGTAFCCDWLY
jgi:hypothetical protein